MQPEEVKAKVRQARFFLEMPKHNRARRLALTAHNMLSCSFCLHIHTLSLPNVALGHCSQTQTSAVCRACVWHNCHPSHWP